MPGFKNFTQFKNFSYVATKLMSFLVHAGVGHFLIGDEIKKRKRGMGLTHAYAKSVLKNMGFDLQIKGNIPSSEKNYFMVCNHMSYIDIVVLSSIRPSMFVTSVEMENTLLLGELSKLGGSYFVERRNKAKLPQEIEDLAELLRKGLDVFVFPEGTSTNGQEILRFKRALFQSAVLAQKDILPICLKYEFINGEKFSPQNADKVCWYGDMDFFPHMLGLMDSPQIKTTVEYLDPIPIAGQTKESLADLTEGLVRAKYFS